MADDIEDENVGTSPYQRLKVKARKKMDDLADDVSREFKEELRDNKKNIRKAEDVASDLVDPETLDRLKEIIMEKPEIEEGCDYKLWFHIIKKTITYIIMKLVDIATDFGAAYQHFKRGDLKYGFLTLFFVYLPGFVLSVGFAYWGLSAKRKGDPPQRKEITCKRLSKYIGLLFLFPFLYPIVQVLLGFLLVALLVRRRDHEPLKFMGHDLKQFKSLEGFLESGPQFALQSYILMIGQKKDTNIDFNEITEDDAERLAILSFSVLCSFLSLVKTAYQVNVPDPDPRRRDKQYKKNAPCFKVTLFFFKLTCVLFRILSLSFFFVYLRQWTMLLVVTAFFSNVVILFCVEASITIIIILGAISIFVPNGYLLYNFAGTIHVDLTRSQSKILFLTSTFVVNFIWFAGIVGVIVLAEVYKLPDEHAITDQSTQYKFVMAMDIFLLIIGVLSSILALVHWYASIEKLFEDPEEEEAQMSLTNL
eukprot:TRINITY_DN26239_c0_g1_i1.p1 TRINITY_DN26239_c0_g1~~TRINITY_DN26239_c0_g1_i1.p1  ORF type:complete len:478 (+),score=77.25 TRINITY_DN26239_c0_g1_i1:95-1528(+)